MKVSECKDVLPFLIKPFVDVNFKRVQCDSRLIQRGDIFVAIKGNNKNGAHYIATAIKKGAVAVLRAPNKKVLPVPTLFATDVRRAMAELAAASLGYPSINLDIFAITGTNGKTTTAWLLYEILKSSGYDTGLLTTVVSIWRGHIADAVCTTPGSCELQDAFRAMLNKRCDCAVMEASSHALDQQRTAATRFKGVAFTNLTEDHLDYHKTMEAYRRAKQILFEQAAENGNNPIAAVFIDAPGGEDMAKFCENLPLRLLRCGFGRGDVYAENISIGQEGSTFTIVFPDGNRIEIEFQLAGRYNIANALCAATLAWAYGVPVDKIDRALCNAEPRWGRFQRVPLKLPFSVFVDYAHTDDALRNVLTAAREMCKGRLLVVFGCGGDRDRNKRPLMGAACAECADILFVTSDNPRSEEPMDIIAEILKGIPPGTDFRVEPDRGAAILLAMKEAKEGDIIVIAGKGHERFQTVKGVNHYFSDFAEVKYAQDLILSE